MFAILKFPKPLLSFHNAPPENDGNLHPSRPDVSRVTDHGLSTLGLWNNVPAELTVPRHDRLMAKRSVRRIPSGHQTANNPILSETLQIGRVAQREVPSQKQGIPQLTT